MEDFQVLTERLVKVPGECFFLDKVVGAVSDLASGFFGGASANEERRRGATTAYRRQLDAFGRRYQLQMEDMRRAGLNPILAYRQAPPGMPMPPMPMVENIGLSAAQTSQASSASALARTQRQVARETVHRERATTDNIRADTRVKRAEEILRGTNIAAQSIRNRILVEELTRARAGASSARHTERIYESDVGGFLRWADEIMRVLRGRGGARPD